MFDPNDVDHVRRLGLDPIICWPAPIGGRNVINPHVTRFHLGHDHYADCYHVKPVYYENLEHRWRPLVEVTEKLGNHEIILKPDCVGRISPRFLRWLHLRCQLIGGKLDVGGGVAGLHHWEQTAVALTLTKYPDPNPESATVDGQIRNSSSDNWNTVHDATTGTANDSATTFIVESEDNGNRAISRAATLFDTSALTASAKIEAGVASLWVTSKINEDNDARDYIGLVQSFLAGTTSLAAGDYNGIGSAVDDPVQGATGIDITSITTGQYTDFTMDATGRGWINLTGNTDLGWREGHDIEDVPTNNEDTNSVTCSSADETAGGGGTDQDPKLVVTYTIAKSAGVHGIVG